MKTFRFYIWGIGTPLCLIFLSVFLGRYPISVSDVVDILTAPFTGTVLIDSTQATILWYVRLPRLILGALVGGSLAVSGAAFQSLFKNPLVSSGMLGVSSGAGFGAALAIVLFQSFYWVYPFSFVFGLVAVLLCFIIGRFTTSTQAITLVLGGVVVGSIFSALISFLKYVADPYNELPTIVFWLMGSLSRANWDQILFAGIPMVAGFLGLFLIRWRLNILAMGDRQARALGLNVQALRLFVVICATLATAGAVCVSGVIGWIGLVVPHIGRMMVGNNNNTLIPVSFCLGASFLIIVDDISRLMTSSEIPLGILTALIGGPFFIYLLKKTKGRQW